MGGLLNREFVRVRLLSLEFGYVRSHMYGGSVYDYKEQKSEHKSIFSTTTTLASNGPTDMISIAHRELRE